MVAPKLHLHLQKHALVCLSVRLSVRRVAVTVVVTASNFALLLPRSLCGACARKPSQLYSAAAMAACEGGRFCTGKVRE